MKKNSKIKIIRWILLGLFLFFITIQAYMHQILGGDESPSIHALCPYGGLESLYSLIGSGTLLQKIFSGTMILLVITILLALLFRRSFCGLLCPFGALQEFFGLLGKKIFKKRFSVPTNIDKPLRYLKYIVLLVTIYYAWTAAGLWVSPYDPWAAYGHMGEGISPLISEFLIGFILLIVTVLGSMLYDRFFCKYLCPMGAVYGLISKLSPYKIVRNKDKCINCEMCNKTCPMNIDIAGSNQITSSECINCQLCVLSCPKEGCLQSKQAGKVLKPAVAITIVITLFFGGVLLSKAVGIFSTLPAPITASSTITVEDIKGYMTLKEVSIGLKIDAKELYKIIGIPENVPAETKLKDVKNFVPEFSVEEAKAILQLRKFKP